MRRVLLTLVTVTALLALPGAAGVISRGTPDTAHPVRRGTACLARGVAARLYGRPAWPARAIAEASMPGTTAKRLAAVPVACAAPLAEVPTAHAMVVDSESARGHHAYASAAGVIVTPASTRLRVAATPRQRVSGSWTMLCSLGLAGRSASGSFSGGTTLRLTLPIPLPGPDHCTVSAEAQLAHRGRVRVTLLASRASDAEPRRHE